MAIVRLDRVTKRFPGAATAAVEGISLTVSDGEFMVLLGPSGCGKSTTLRMVAGLESMTSGTIEIDGRVVNDVAARDRDIAMVFQSYALYPHMTVYDNLAFGLRRRGIPRAEIERRVREAARVLGLSELLTRKPYALSGGQRQRVAVGRAIVRDPKVFLFDEPLSNLDASLRVTTRNELIKLHQRLRATMIYVTHDQIEAMTMGHRICIMNQGRVVQIGRPLDVYLNPANTFVARFLGNPAMNLIPATVAAADGDVTVRLAGLRVPVAPASRAGLYRHNGRTVLLGIRPEDRWDGGRPRRGTGSCGRRRAARSRDLADPQRGGRRGGHHSPGEPRERSSGRRPRRRRLRCPDGPVLRSRVRRRHRLTGAGPNPRETSAAPIAAIERGRQADLILSARAPAPGPRSDILGSLVYGGATSPTSSGQPSSGPGAPLPGPFLRIWIACRYSRRAPPRGLAPRAPEGRAGNRVHGRTMLASSTAFLA
jgi:multiple sugar transport system ATP-binding protein